MYSELVYTGQALWLELCDGSIGAVIGVSIGAMGGGILDELFLRVKAKKKVLIKEELELIDDWD